MGKVHVFQIDAFSDIPGKGNPAGVVLNGEDYNESQMQMMRQKWGLMKLHLLSHLQ